MACGFYNSKKEKINLCWSSPLEGVLKFNVNGARRGKPSPVGNGVDSSQF